MATKRAKPAKKPMVLKTLRWMVSSRRDLRAMPKEVRKHMGTALQIVQRGDTPVSAKPMAGLGKGIFEIVCDFDKDTYRSMYVARFDSAVYVLDSFKKKSRKGIATPPHILDRISDRYDMAVELDKQAKKGTK